MASSPEVIVVGALATKVSNIAPMRFSAERIAGNAPVHYVHGGIFNADGILSVAAPSQQERQITEIIEREPSNNFLILSQSMGALAALNCVEKYEFKNVKSIAVAPPLLYPGETLRSRRIMSMSKIINGQLILPSRSFALGDSGPTKHRIDPSELPDPIELAVTPELFDEIDATNHTYWDRTVSAINKGGLQIVMPTEDWNSAALETAPHLPQVHNLVGPHSLITYDERLQHNIQALAEIAEQFQYSH